MNEEPNLISIGPSLIFRQIYILMKKKIKTRRAIIPSAPIGSVLD
jgi:hypothetical protein